MNTVQGKNVVILGGLQGVGLKLTINLLNKRVKNLYIIDIYDNQTKFIDLKTKFQTTNLFYKNIDEFRFNTEIQRTIQDVCLKIQYIDLVINALEFIVEKDLQRTMDLNMKIYLNTMMAARKVMDRTKGGRGGKIINILSNLGLQNWNIKNNIYGNDGFDQQYLINKQMLLSLTEAYSQDEFFQQTGVAVMCVMPTINKNLLRKNYDWVKKVGLERIVNVMNNWTDVEGLGKRFDLYNDNTKWFDGDYYGNNDFDQDFMTYNTNMDINDDYWYNLKKSQDIDGNFGDFSTMLTMLCLNIVRGIEMGKNGNKIVVGFKGIKNIQKQGVYSPL